jgi:hypothetical protein
VWRFEPLQLHVDEHRIVVAVARAIVQERLDAVAHPVRRCVGARVMSEYASRGGSYDATRASASTSSAVYVLPHQTTAEKARDEIVRAEHEVVAIGSFIDALNAASDANDPARWRDARDSLDASLVSAREDIERARTRASDADPAAQQRLAAAEASLAQYELTATELKEAPSGWKPVSHEEEILATLTAPVEGSKQDGFAQKEERLKAALAQLTPTESSQLAARLTKLSPNDPVAVAFGRFSIDRRGRILTFLRDARRRAAAHSAKLQSAGATSAIPSDPAAASSDSSESDAPNTASVGDAAIEPDTTLNNAHATGSEDRLDVVVGRLLDAGTLQFDDLLMIAAVRRRALAHRLAAYRPGNGDEFSARILRLEASLQEALLAVLKAPDPKPKTDARREGTQESPVDVSASNAERA